MCIAGSQWIVGAIILVPVITIEVQIRATRCVLGVESMASCNVVPNDMPEVQVPGR